MNINIQDSIYGQINITDPVLIEVINTPAMQRLKGVDQTVTGKIVDLPWGSYTRFDHSIGVMWLIKKLGGNLEEQVAGLAHDISHTAFSHIIDFVFDKHREQNFHEEHLERIINQSAIPEILKKHGLSAQRIANHHNYSLLEQDIPALCADRVDYAFKTFEQTQAHDIREIREFIPALMAFEGRIVFNDRALARRFADWFIDADRTVWGGSPIANTAYHLFAEILKSAYKKGIISFDDFFTTDQELLGRLDERTKRELDRLKTLQVLEVQPSEKYDLYVNAKIRYVDPLVKINDKKAKKLSELDPDFKTEIEQALEKRKLGNYVRILNK